MTTKTFDTDLLRAVRNGGKSVASEKIAKRMPVLGCVLVRKSGRKVEIISTDLETVSRDSALAFSGGWFDLPTDADMVENWEVCVPTKSLRDWLKVLEPKVKEPVELELTPEHGRHFNSSLAVEHRSYLSDTPENLIIRAGNITARFKGIMAGQFVCVDHILSKFDGPVIQYKPNGE